MLCEAGRVSRTSRVNTVCLVRLCTSTSGDAPDTVIVSSSAPTFRSPLMVAVKLPVSSMPSRRTVLNPGSENVTV